MPPAHALEFITKHIAHKSISGIAQFAGVDTANLHACLAGKRTWPITLFRKVAAAVGLTANQEQLCLAKDVVIFLEVSGSELPSLASALNSISDNYTWCLVCTQEEPTPNGIHAMTVASSRGSYVVTSIRWDTLECATKGIDEISTLLPGVWLSSNPDAICLSQTSDQWIRLRAGIEPKSTFDGWFDRGVPGIEEWALMLLEASRDGFRPSQVTRILKSMPRFKA